VLAALQNAAAGSSFDLLPISLDLGGKQPATLDGHVDANGYTLHLTGNVICANLIQLGKAVPQIGDGLEDALDELAGVSPNPGEKADAPGSETAKPLPESPIRVDLTATRAWGSAQVWRQTVPAVAGRPKRR
jgi:AsmA protein